MPTSFISTIFDEVLRYVINDYKQKKVPGKQCWSIHCREKISPMNRVKCSGRCDQFFCNDCIEIWEDGFKGCPQCTFLAFQSSFVGIVYEKELRSTAGKTWKVKKARISPQQKVAEQFLAMKKAYEEKLQQQQEATTDTNNESNTTTTTTSTPRDRK